MAMTKKSPESSPPRQTTQKPNSKKPPLIIGWREYVSLPDLGLVDFTAKIDTGARTTALHASDIVRYKSDDGQVWVQFRPPELGHAAPDLCHARVTDFRSVKNSGGTSEERFFIRTRLHIGERAFLIEASLSDRAEMKYPMIIGRTALRGHRLVVDCSHSWLTKPKSSVAVR